MPHERSSPNSRGTGAKPVLTAALVGAAGLLAACDSEDAATTGSANAVDDSAMETLLEDVPENGSRLSLTGAVTDTGEFTTGEAGRYAGSSEDVFRPARGGRGSNARRGSNEDGPYMFNVYTDAVHQDDEDDVVRAWITIVLPEGAGPGSYEVAPSRSAEDDEAQASLAGDGYGWIFAREIEGALHVAELGERLTAAWDFEARDGSGDTVHVTGGVSDLPFSPQQEAEYRMVVGGEETEHLRRVSANQDSRGRYTLLLGSGVYLDLPAGAGEGSYPIRERRQDDGDVSLNLPDHNVEEADGELTLERDGAYLHGSFSLTATGEEPIEIEGSLRHLQLAGS